MKLISKSEAKAQGLRHYFTGRPCKHGHLEKRFVASWRCLGCNRDSMAAFRLTNSEHLKACKRLSYSLSPEKAKAYARARREANPEMTREEVRRWQAAHRERTRELALAWAKANPEQAKANRSKRRAALRRAVPVWFGEFDELVMLEAADLAARRKEATQIDWHIDHMIPLRAKCASGLHVWNNLQVIPGALNSSKKAKMIYTEIGEWISRI